MTSINAHGNDDRISVLILGSNGFIGRELCEFFRSDDTFRLTSCGREDVNLTDSKSVDEFFSRSGDGYDGNDGYDVVINSCSIGGSRLIKDDEKVFHQNIMTFENVMRNRNKFKMLFYFGSGASSRDDHYGNSKNVIEKLSLVYDNVYILRIYNCFGKSELDTRFIKSCIRSCKSGEIFTIETDMYFDFFYVGDLFKVIKNLIRFKLDDIKYYESNVDIIPKIIDMCYEQKYLLSNVAYIIALECGKSGFFSPTARIVEITNKETGDPYTAPDQNRKILNRLSIKDLYGLKEGIRMCL